MAPSTTPIPPPVIPPHPKTKRPVPAGIQTNGLASSSSPSPSMSAKKAPNSAKALAKSAAANGGTVTVARPNNQIRSEITALPNGNVRSSISAAAQPAPSSAIEQAAVPVVVEQPPSRKYILRKYVGNPPSLIVHLHPTHWKFDSQDDYFLYTSPMKTFLEHLRARTIPHDMMAELTEDEVPFYEGCLIVEVHDHRTAAVAEKDEARPSSRSKEDTKNSIHKYNRFITPSPNKPFPKEVALANGLGKKSDTNQQEKRADSAEQGSSSASSSPQGQKNKTPIKTRISTLVLFPTQQSRQADLALKACNPRGSADGAANGVPPTPSAVPPTPTGTGSSMPPPAKRVKRERMELDSANIREAEGAMLVATLPPLDLEPTKDARGTIAKLEAQTEALKHRFLPAPKPVTRKRTVAEMAADEAQAAGHERYLLTLDDRNGQGGISVPGGDGQQQQQHFDPDFGRFKKIEEIKREHLERATQEKLQQAEKERALQDRKQQQQQQQAQAQAQLLQQQAEERNRQDQEQQRAQLQAQQEALRRRQQMMAQQQAQQRQQQQALAMGQNAHGHPMPNGQVNGGQANLPVSAPNGMAMAGARLQAAASQPPASSPMVRQNTPQNMSSPMVGAVAMQASGSSIGAGSPARPPSVVNQPPMSAPMAVSMSARGSQQSHPSGTPRMPNATPNMAHATPISRAQQLANTPRMTQASPPPNMMAPQMQSGMMNNASNAAAHAQMVAASQRNIQQANMFNNGGMNLTPQQQQQRLMMQAAAQQQQARMQQQLQQNPQLAQNPQLMQQFLMQQQRQQAQAFAQQQAQQGARQNMGNIQSGVQFPSQQAAAMYQMQQQQQLQQLAVQQQAGQSQQQQMQAQQRMGQPGQQIPAHMQNNLMMHFQRLYTQNLPKWLQNRGYASPEVVPPQELEGFKRQCNNAARQQMMQVMARQQNAQQMSPQQQQQQQQQQQLMFQQQRMQAMQAQAQAQAMHQQQMHMMSQQGL